MSGRRNLLGAAAGLLAAPVVPRIAAAVTPSPDAELIRLAALHGIVSGESRVLSDRWTDLDEPPEVEARIRVLVKQGHDIAQQMANLDATTLDGFKAKARVLLYYTMAWANGSPMWGGHNELLGWSLAMDLTGGEGFDK